MRRGASALALLAAATTFSSGVGLAEVRTCVGPDGLPVVGLVGLETIAGGGSVGDGGLATEARLSLPGGVVVAPNGDLIVVDFGNHRVRRVDMETGRIRTIAGTGEAGFSGDGGPANQARLARPENAAFGPSGDLYIVDSHNHRVRRIDRATGVIDTIAGSGTAGFGGDGGPARDALFSQPEGIAFHPNGDAYIGDTINGRVRRVDAITGTISTIAGSGLIGTSEDGASGSQVHFLRLARLAVASNGDVYIADSPSHKIHRIEAKSGRLRTVGGTGVEGFSGDSGPAVSAQLSYPEGVTLDRDGNVYFADLGNHRVRRIDAQSGVITTVAGTGDRGFSGDGGSALSAQLWSPGRIAVDRKGRLLIADILNARIRRVNATTGVIETVVGSGVLGDAGAGTGGSLSIPGDLALVGRDLYVAEYGNRRVRRLDLDTGVISTIAGGGLSTRENVAAGSFELKLPEAIAVDPKGERLYIADSLAHTVWRVELGSGGISRYAGTGEPGFSGDGAAALAADLSLPGAVAAAADGRVFVGDFGNARIRVVDRAGLIDTLRADDGSELKVAPVSLAVTHDALLWVGAGSPDIFRYEFAETRRVSRIEVRLPYRSRRARGHQLGDLSVAADGSVIVADTLAHRLVAVDPRSGAATLVAGNGDYGFDGDGPALEQSLYRPGGVVAGTGGRLYVADTFNHRVRTVCRATSSSEGAAGG